MKKVFLFLAICVGFSSCFLFPKLKKQSFSYAANGGAQTLEVVVPRGYRSVQTIALSDGTPMKVYQYGDGATLYMAQMKDTNTLIYPVDLSRHIPLPHPAGGSMYKGVDTTYRVWREIKNGTLRFGYRNVTIPVEPRFDSALNFAAAQVPR